MRKIASTQQTLHQTQLMNQSIVQHLFEFWSEIGKSGGFLHQEKGFSFTKAARTSWPSKVFHIHEEQMELSYLKHEIQNRNIPNSIGIHQQKGTRQALEEYGFIKTSSVKAMAFEVENLADMNMDQPQMLLVDSITKAKTFAMIASKSFGYDVLEDTITKLLPNPSINLFIGKFKENHASCGMIFQDENGIAGIHMIGTLPDYRGHGLGKKMTQYLICEAIKKESPLVYLVASEAGEKIYAKLGFKSFGALESYMLLDHSCNY